MILKRHLNKHKCIYFKYTVLFISFLVCTQCKTGEVTFLGFFKKSFGENAEKGFKFDSQRTFTISGQITDIDNKPIDKAKIYIIKKNRILLISTSDVHGNFKIANIKKDIYAVHLIAPNSRAQHRQEINLNKISDLNNINFKFKTHVP
jgi:hypothetical protein